MEKDMNKLFFVLLAIIGHQTVYSMYPLHEAAFYGDLAKAAALIKAGADVNEMNDCKYTPLYFAVLEFHRSVVRLLLENKADPNKFDRSRDPIVSPLWRAVNYDETEVVNMLLDHGADANLYNSAGRRPLHLAGDVSIVRSLLNYRADPNAKDENGWTPLHFAADSNGRQMLEILRVLLEYGADWTLRTNRKIRFFNKTLGKTAWEIAQIVGNADAAKVLENWSKVQCAKARLTVLMGGHPRAGANSNLNLLDQHLLCTIAENYICPIK